MTEQIEFPYYNTTIAELRKHNIFGALVEIRGLFMVTNYHSQPNTTQPNKIAYSNHQGVLEQFNETLEWKLLSQPYKPQEIEDRFFGTRVAAIAYGQYTQTIQESCSISRQTESFNLHGVLVQEPNNRIYFFRFSDKLRLKPIFYLGKPGGVYDLFTE